MNPRLARGVLDAAGMPPLPALGQATGVGATWPSVERRAHRRVPLGAPLEIRTDDRLVRGTCLNVSVGGLAAIVEGAPVVGTALELSLVLPGGPAIEMRGEVVRIEGAEVGMRFVALGQRALLAILTYVGGH